MDRSAAGGLTVPDGASGAGAPAFSGWLDDFFQAYYRHRPVTATFAGVHLYDDRLPSYSEHGFGDALADAETLLARLAVLPEETLSVEQQLDRRAAEGFLRTQLWEYDSPHFRWSNPSLHTGEAIFGVIALLLQEQTPIGRRLDLAADRLNAMPTLLMQCRWTVRAAPAAWIERARRETHAALIFLSDGVDRYVAEHGYEDTSFRAAARRAFKALDMFELYLGEDLLPAATDEYGCGADVFEMLLREAHFLDADAAGLEARALDLMAEAEAALVAGAAQFGATDWQGALAGLADHHPTTEQFPTRFAELWHAHRAAAKANDLLTVPDWPVEWRPRPAWLGAAASALYFIPYRSPAPYDRPAGGIQYIPILPPGDPAKQEAALRATNDQVIKQNYIVHHAGIGHHAQNWYAMNAASRIGQMAGVDGASRIAMLCGGTLTEGWASYVTDLMDEIGFLTPLESFAQEYAKLRMAARTVVDVRLHEGRISLDEGQRFYEERAGMSAAASRAEVVKNSLFPATGCMYLAGWDGIVKLRRAVEQREGSGFSRQRFHDRLLSFGSVPVALLEPLLLDAPATSGGARS
jgi:uncharacterized protein (DUF885 family)